MNAKLDLSFTVAELKYKTQITIKKYMSPIRGGTMKGFNHYLSASAQHAGEWRQETSSPLNHQVPVAKKWEKNYFLHQLNPYLTEEWILKPSDDVNP